MGAALTIANEKQAYALTDRGSYLSRTLNDLDLDVLMEGDPTMVNIYSILPITPDKPHDLNYGGAIAFINWITSAETQARIGDFGVKEFGRPLYYPSANQP